MTPTIAPCTTKMPMMLRGLAPSVRRIAMSARLSVTVITSVETRLNAATATISVRMMNIMRFSICTAANQVLFARVQSRIRKLARQRGRQLVGHLARLVQVLELEAHAGRAVEAEHALPRPRRWIMRQRRVVLVVARIEGADHGELLEARHHAGRRHLAARRHQRDLVADRARTASAPARRPARCRTRPAPACRARPAAQWSPMSVTCGSSFGHRCRAPARPSCPRRAPAAPAPRRRARRRPPRGSCAPRP